MDAYNVYCDESCHLENDKIDTMVLGAVICKRAECKTVFKAIREIKKRHNLNELFEIKWTKVSQGKQEFYKELINYFFDNELLKFRAVVISNKCDLNHVAFEQSHDEWYFKMYFDMLKIIFEPKSQYKIYLDVKDTRSSEKVQRLHEVLCNNMLDFNKEIIEDVQTIRSHEIELVQMADLLIGAVGYVNRNLYSNPAKVALIKLIQERSGYNLTKTTLYREEKFNLLAWTPEAI